MTGFPDEITHLDDIKAKLDEAIRKANVSVERLDMEYMDIKVLLRMRR